jgi:hypothetical protein
MTVPPAHACSQDPLEAFASTLEASSPEEAMRISCRRLLEEAGQPGGPPPLSRLMARLGARRRDQPLPTAGRLRIDEQGYLICVRSGTPWQRGRFTVAHELGHILLCERLSDQPEMLRALRGSANWEAVERLCNQAAAELLMPAEDFRRQVEGVEITGAMVARLRRRYGVSLSALAIRFDELMGLAVSSWRRYQRHPKERVTFRVECSWGVGAWLPRGLTTRYLRPDVINRAVEEGHVAGLGVLAFGATSKNVFATAVALEDERGSRSPAISFEEPQPPSLSRSDPRVILFLRVLDEAPPGGERRSPKPQQLMLIT